MARQLAEILDADIIAFRRMIEEWERNTGKRGHDIALISELKKHTLDAARSLGLDPTDTVPAELYFALQHKAGQDDTRLAHRLGISSDSSPTELTDKLLKWLKTEATDGRVWSIKPATLRILLKKCPPKNTMKAIGLRSVDSMLKRVAVGEIMALSHYYEQPQWKKRFAASVKKCQSKDFHDHAIEVVRASSERCGRLRKNGYPTGKYVTVDFLSGTVYVVEPPYRFPLDSLALFLSLAQAVYDVRTHSTLLRILSVRGDFGSRLEQIVLHGISRASLDLSDISWNSLHRHLVGNEYALSKIDQPHISAHDITAKQPLHLLSEIDPGFSSWQALDHVLFSRAGSPAISLNLLDVVVNASNRHAHHQAVSGFGRMRLWEELWARYLRDEKVIERVIDEYLHEKPATMRSKQA